MAETEGEEEVGVEEDEDEDEEEEAQVEDEEPWAEDKEAALQRRDSRGAKVHEGDGEWRAEVLAGEKLVASVTGAYSYSKEQKTSLSKMSSSPNLLSSYQCPPAPSAPHARVPSRRRLRMHVAVEAGAASGSAAAPACATHALHASM